MSGALTMPVIDDRGLQSLMDGLRQIAETVQTAPLTRDELMRRWQMPEVKTFQRWCERVGLRPFEGAGKNARYRMTAILRAEERGEKLNGGLN